MAIDMSKIASQKAALEERLTPKSGGGAKFWRPNTGDNKIRIMPPWESEGFFEGQFWREVGQHWNVNPENKGPMLCPDKTPGLEGECPVCEFVDTLRQDKGNVEAQELVKQIRAKTAYFLNVVDLSDPVYTAQDVAEYTQERPDKDVPFEAGNPKIQVYAAPSTVFNQILGIIKVNQIDITDLSEGHDIVISKKGAGLTTKYETQLIIKATTSDVSEDVTLNDLSKVGRVFKYDELLTALTSGVGGDFAVALPAGGTEKRLASVTTDEVVNDESKVAADADDIGASLRAAMK